MLFPRLRISHRLRAAAHAIGRGVDYDAEDRQHREQRVDHVQYPLFMPNAAGPNMSVSALSPALKHSYRYFSIRYARTK